MKFIFSNYVKIIKNVCKNPDISNEEIIRALFDIFDEDNEVDIDPSDATHIMKRETSIPKKIMQDLTDSIEKDVVENCNLFIEYYIDNKRFVEFKNKISSVLDCDKTVKEFVKDYINRSINDNNDIFLYRTLVEVLRVPNKLLDTKINLWKKGKNEINIYYGDIFRLAFGSKYKSEKKR